LEKITEERVQTTGEEIANSISHGVGALLSVLVTPLMIIQANKHGGVYDIVGASVFGATMINLYLSSTLYHALSRTRARRIFQILDHAAIYLLIAGTYTPFTIGVLRGPWGWTLFGLIWGLAFMGVLLKTFGRLWKGSLSTILYVAMGWIVVIAIKPFWELVPGWGIIWLALGGFFYTLGVVFFLLDKVKYSHFVWHLFVVAGTACHVVAVMSYARG
jgi:hemolysin III